MQKFLSRFSIGFSLGMWGVGITYYRIVFEYIEILVGPFWFSIYVGSLEDTI